MPVVPASQTIIDTKASSSTKSAKSYPNPFFDLANNFIPSDIKTLFKFCKSFYYTNSFLRNVVTKLTEYPITEILYDQPIAEDWKDKLDDILHKQIKLKSFLIESGLDYFTYGNAFITASMKPKRFLKCGICGHEDLLENTKFKLKKYKFFGDCNNKKCGAKDVPMAPLDMPVTSFKNFRLHRWSPENIDIEYNSITGATAYYYTIPANVKKQITSGNKTVLKDIPLVFLDSLRESKKIEISSENLFHFKYPTLAEEDMGWGKPLILPALKDIYYLQTLKRGNEAIANEHIVPKKAVFPANTTTLDPYSMAPDTLVITNNGVKELQNIDFEHDNLYTYEGNKTKIVNYKLRELEDWDYMLNIISFGLHAYDTKVNSVHPFRVWNPALGNHEWKEAKYLTSEDYTAYPIKILSDIEVNITTNDYIFNEWRTGTQQLPETITLNNSFAKFIGYYLAEGYISDTGMVGFSFNSNETNYHEEVKTVLDSLLPGNTETEIRINGSQCDVRKQSVVLSEFLKNLIGKGFDKKSIKNIDSLLTKENALALLNGVFNGDGTFFYEKGKYPKLNLKLSNLSLIYELRELLLSLHYYPTIVKDDSSYCLKLYGYQAEDLAKKFGYPVRDLYSEEKNNKYFFKDNFVYSKINSIKTIEERTVLSIEVEDQTHSYLSLGYINKNTQMNLGKWRVQIEGQVEKWKKDPNHIGVFPIPIGYQELGGNARMLLLTPELKFLEENIINSLGVPLEFIKGGASWTGSSVSLRIVENHFLGYRELLLDFMNYFLMERLNAFLKVPKVKLKFAKFKMNDDSETKQLAIELNAAGKISDYTLLSEMGHDPETEAIANKAMRETLSEEQIHAGELQAEAQGKAMVIQARYQVRAQRAANDERMKLQAELFQDELVKENLGIPEDPMKLIDKYAMEIFYMDPKSQQQYLDEMSVRMPITYRLVLDRLNMYQTELYNLPMIGEQMPSGTAIQQEAPNQQQVGTRQKDKVKVRDKAKTKGQTRGQP